MFVLYYVKDIKKNKFVYFFLDLLVLNKACEIFVNIHRYSQIFVNFLIFETGYSYFPNKNKPKI